MLKTIEILIIGLIFYSCSNKSDEVNKEVLNYKITEQFSFNDSLFESKSRKYKIAVIRKDSILDWKYSGHKHRIKYILDSDYSIKKILNWSEFRKSKDINNEEDSVLIIGKLTSKEQDYNQGLKFLDNREKLKENNIKFKIKNGFLMFNIIGYYKSNGLDLYMPNFRKLIPIKEINKIGVLEMNFEYTIDIKNKRIQKIISTISAPINDDSIYLCKTTMELAKG